VTTEKIRQGGLARCFIVATISYMNTIKIALTATVIVLAGCVGCSGSAFSAEEVAPTDDAGGDVVVKTDGNDAGTDVATDTDAGKPEASPPEAGSAPEAGLDAAPEAAPPACLYTLNGIGTENFHISFTMTSVSTQVLVPLVNQKAGCNDTSVWWQTLVDGYLGGKIVFNMCDVTGSGSCPTGPTVYTSDPVDDGQPHRIVIERVSGVISISSDGVMGTTSPDITTGAAAGIGADASFETFGAPLSIGTDDCGDLPLAGYGTLTDLCIATP
jgi:hypothetical protein